MLQGEGSVAPHPVIPLGDHVCISVTSDGWVGRGRQGPFRFSRVFFAHEFSASPVLSFFLFGLAV